jgi:hypothetical protein
VKNYNGMDVEAQIKEFINQKRGFERIYNKIYIIKRKNNSLLQKIKSLNNCVLHFVLTAEPTIICYSVLIALGIVCHGQIFSSEKNHQTIHQNHD